MKWWLLLLLTIIVSHPYITLTAGNPFRSTNTTTGGGKADLSGQYWTWLLRGFKKGYKLGSRYSQWFVKRLLLFFCVFRNQQSWAHATIVATIWHRCEAKKWWPVTSLLLTVVWFEEATACQRGQGYSAALSLVTCRTPSSGIQHTKMLALNVNFFMTTTL